MSNENFIYIFDGVGLVGFKSMANLFLLPKPLTPLILVVNCFPFVVSLFLCVGIVNRKSTVALTVV